MSYTTWTTRLDKITYAVSTEFGKLDSQELNWKPNPDTWSIAQNLDHIIRVNETYYPTMDQVVKESYKVYFLGRIGFVVKFFGKLILNAVEPTRKRRMKTMALWEPTQSQDIEDILNRYSLNQLELIRRMNACQEFVRNGTVISSPANRNIVYKLATAFEIMVSHEERHLEQAREVLAKLPEDLAGSI